MTPWTRHSLKVTGFLCLSVALFATNARAQPAPAAASLDEPSAGTPAAPAVPVTDPEEPRARPLPPPRPAVRQARGDDPNDPQMLAAPRAGGQGRRSVGLMIGGIVTLGASYAITALVGLQLVAAADKPDIQCSGCDEIGTRLLIPILGPWVALTVTPDDAKILDIVMGLAQATGLFLTITGVSRFNASGPGESPGRHRGLALTVLPTPTGGTCGVLAGVF